MKNFILFILLLSNHALACPTEFNDTLEASIKSLEECNLEARQEIREGLKISQAIYLDEYREYSNLVNQFESNIERINKSILEKMKEARRKGKLVNTSGLKDRRSSLYNKLASNKIYMYNAEAHLAKINRVLDILELLDRLTSKTE